jgi:hypothetical protein
MAKSVPPSGRGTQPIGDDHAAGLSSWRRRRRRRRVLMNAVRRGEVHTKLAIGPLKMA